MSAPDMPSAKPRDLKRIALVIVTIVVIVLVAGTAARLLHARALGEDTKVVETPTVSVITLARAEASETSLPGRLQAWIEAPVYARTSGYLRRWRADIGARVRAGAVLGEIEAPELDQQLSAAVAARNAASAQLALAEISAQRWRRLIEAGAVSQQAADERFGELATSRAARDEAAAEVQRLRALTGFKSIVAPFDGVVTQRNTDVGALIVAGGSTAAPLFTVADDRRLRLYVNLPENSPSLPARGSTARFSVPDQPGREFTATVLASASAIDPQTGAMTMQLVVDNADGALRPGGYAMVAFAPAAGDRQDLRLPASALLYRQEGPAVAVVDGQNRVMIRPITLGRDYGRDVAVSTGLTGQERVIDNPSSAIANGQSVRIAAPNAPRAGVANARP